MQEIITKHTTILICILFSLLAAVFLIVTTKPIYEVNSTAIIYRNTLPSIDMDVQDSSNRWIWIREGLSIQKSLLSDDFLNHLTDSTPALNEQLAHYLKKEKKHGDQKELTIAFYEELRKKIKIHYSGADENSYRISIKSNNPKMGKDISLKILERLKELAIERNMHVSREKLYALSKRAKYSEELYNKLFYRFKLEQEEASHLFKIVEQPFIPLSPIWPQKSFILIVAAVLGTAIGFLIEYYKLDKEEE